MAQQIVAELKGKLIDFAVDVEHPKSLRPHMRRHEVEALEILIAWGEKRTEAMDLIEIAQQRHPDVDTAEALVPLVYRMKQGIEV
jgi:Holliday junction resolvasome RuvABC DNA-binding subunit